MKFSEALNAPSVRQTWPWIWSAPLVLILVQYQSVAPVGHAALLTVELPYALAMMAAVAAIFVLPFRALRRSSRSSALVWLLVAVAFLSLSLCGLLLGNAIRHRGFDRLALRSTFLVEAIKKYEAVQGRPPPTLEALVPDYLPQVPRTGMMAYAKYQYHVDAEARRYGGNPWVLTVFCPSGGINFDQFMYFPLQNYPATGYGGSLERMGEWAYLHE